MDEAPNYDTAIIVSGDSDLIPAVKMVRKNFPEKKISVCLPINGKGHHLKSLSDFNIKMKLAHLQNNLLPEKLTSKSGRSLVIPDSWK